jgi:class 3 adenylate cyclase/tetratricopeptide (TPR) repeat protein
VSQVCNVRAWLEANGFARFAPTFEENEIDGETLLELTEEHLKDFGIALGPRLKLLKAIESLRRASNEEAPTPVQTRKPGPLGQRTPEAERRQLTVLFCDLVGSTELAARLDPEDLRAVMRGYHAACADVIGHFDGYIAKFLGDGVLVYFGWPTAHEDDAERAVRAGLVLVETISRLETAVDQRLSARVGIATGVAVVGDLIGEGAAREEAVVGDVPNRAARLQAVAAPGSVVISQATRRLIGGLFVLDDLGPQRLKGFAEPLTAWRVAGEGGAEGRFEARQTAGLTPLVGREEELALLLRRWQQAKDGEGHVVLLSGEPGIGKSRLVRELRARLADQPHLRLLYQCSPHHTTSPLHPLIAQLERAAGFERDDPSDARLDKLETLLARGSDRLDQAVPLIAALLGLPTEDRHPPLELTPQRRKQLTLEVLVDQLDGLAAAQPVLFAYEDVHWSDPTTQELLGLTIERIQHLSVLALITFRPEFVPPWPAQPHLSALALTRLGRREGAALVEQVVGDKTLPDEIASQIVAKTDGVPLFVEELTKTVLESGLLRDAGDHYELLGPLPPLAIPATLHDSLLARLDRLAPVKEVVQIGAALGREFSHALLAAVDDRSEAELKAALDQLVASELVFRRGTPPEATYSFKHALVQDAAYGTLLKSRRQQLHARITQVLEGQFPKTVETQPEVLAHHCTQAGFIEKAVEYWHRAGERAARRSANIEAIRHLETALELLASQPDDRRRAERELGLLTLLSPALMVIKGTGAEEVATTLERARRAARELQSLDHIIPATLGLWLFHNSRGDFGRARELTQELFEFAKQRDDDGFLLQAHHAGWTTPFFTGNFAEVRDHVGRGLALYDEQRHRGHALVYIGHDPAACAHALGAVSLWMLGFPDQALRHSVLAITRGEQSSHPPTLAHALWYVGNLHVLRNDHVAVAGLAERYLSISSEFGMAPGIATADSLAGWAEAREGKVEAGLARLQRGVEAWKAIGGQSLHLPQRLSLLAEGLGLAGRAAEALAANAEAHRLAQSTGEGYHQAVILWQRGWLLGLDAADRAQAEAAFGQTIEVARRQQAKSLELRAATSLARLWRDQGKRAQARDMLAPVYGWFTEGFDTADLKDAKALLEDLA